MMTEERKRSDVETWAKALPIAAKKLEKDIHIFPWAVVRTVPELISLHSRGAGVVVCTVSVVVEVK